MVNREELQKFRRQIKDPVAEADPEVENTTTYVYHFEADGVAFDIRAMKIDNPAYRHFEEQTTDEDIPEDASWSCNQFSGEPSMGTNNYFTNLKEMENRILELIEEVESS